MSGTFQEFTTVAGAIAAISINSLWQDALLVACVWLLLRAWPALNASTRYTVWSITLVAAIVVPVATTLPFFTAPGAPASVATSPQPQRAARTSAHAGDRLRETIAPARSATASATMPAPAARLPQRLHLTLPLALAVGVFAAWALFALYALVRLAIGLIRLEGLKRDALPLPVEYRETMSQWMHANKGSREVRLCVSDAIDVPVAVGLFDSMILIPHSLLEHLSEAEVDQITLHELAHLRRRDDWSNGLQRVLLAFTSWNPAAQFVGLQLDFEREVACDDWVLSLVGAVRPYAMCLTKMAETASWPRQPMPAPGVFATRRHISMRIERLLAAGRNIATNLAFGPAAVAVAAVTAVAIVIAVVAPSVAAPTIPTPPVVASVAKVAARPSPATTTKLTVRRVAQAAAPALPQTYTPGEVVVPRTHVHVPSVEAHVPSMTIPAQTFKVPATTVTVPEMRIAIPGIDADKLTKSIYKSVAQSTGVAIAGAQGVQNGRTCTACDFARVNWSGRDLHGVEYTGVDLSDATLAGTNFAGGRFSGVDFSRANLNGASFRNARLVGCDFSHANLTNVDFTGAMISGCQFTGATLTSSTIRDVFNSCRGCDFNQANLSGVDLSNVRASGDDLSRADLRGANLGGAHLTNVDLSGARLDGVNLAGATLTNCDLSDVDLRHVDLSKAHLIDTEVPTN